LCDGHNDSRKLDPLEHYGQLSQSQSVSKAWYGSDSRKYARDNFLPAVVLNMPEYRLKKRHVEPWRCSAINQRKFTDGSKTWVSVALCGGIWSPVAAKRILISSLWSRILKFAMWKVPERNNHPNIATIHGLEESGSR
jgi:hypothetical protein